MKWVVNFWTLYLQEVKKADSTNQLKMGLGKLMGNRSIERYCEEKIRSYLLTPLNKVLVDAWGVGEE